MQHYLLVSGQLHNLAPSFTHNDTAGPESNPLVLM